jgi:hypothetical protein
MDGTTTPKAIENEDDYQLASRVLARKKQPSRVLRLMMNSYEQYRQSRKYGWSRPWNKVGLMNFQSFKPDLGLYPEFIDIARALLNHESLALTSDAQEFANDLLNDPKLMCFIFVHENTQQNQKYEGATLSFGRVHDKRYRDRVDIIVEAPVVDGISQGLERVRVFVDPYRAEDKQPLWQGEILSFENYHSFSLFALVSNVSWNWANDKKKIWNHWTSIYIDYFGDRQWSMDKSYFYVEGQQDCRIKVDIPESMNLQIPTSISTESVA